MSAALDTCLRVYSGRIGETVVVPPMTEGESAGTSDPVKITHCCDFIADGADETFYSGSEQVVDMVRNRRVTLRRMRLVPGRQNAITIKGGVRTWLVEDVTLLRHSRGPQDIDLGNWTDYDRYAYVRTADGTLKLVRLPRTSGGTLRRVRMADGSRVRVRCLYADRPQLDDTDVEWVGLVPRVPLLNRPLVAAWWYASRHGVIETRKPTRIEDAILADWEIAA